MPGMRFAFSPAKQKHKISILASFERASIPNPHLKLGDALARVQRELFELELLTGVNLQNPAVLSPIRQAIINLRAVERIGQENPEYAADLAREAIRQQIQSLIAGYRTIAGSFIVDSRHALEFNASRLETQMWAGKHEKARAAYQQARELERSFRYDEAREAYIDAIMVAQSIYAAFTD